MGVNKKILVIDDDLDIRTLYSELLTDNGYDTDVAVSGEEGLYKARNASYDLILLDIMMSNENGLDVLLTLKKDNPTRKVMICTNLSGPEVSEEAKKNGADEFFVKSNTDPGKLLEKVTSLL